MKYSRKDVYIGANINGWIITSDIYFKKKINKNNKIIYTYFVKAICNKCNQEKEVRVNDIITGKSLKCIKCNDSDKKYTNRYQIFGDYAVLVIENIKTHEIYKFLFDRIYLDKIKEHYWGIVITGNGTTYARASDYEGSKNKNLQRLHRFLYQLKYGEFDDKLIIDHKDRNTFNNLIKNFNLVTPLENAQNSSLRKDNTSGVKGVHFNKRTNKWIARIQFNKKRISLGSFDTLEEAVEARRKAEKEYHKYNESIKGEIK